MTCQWDSIGLTPDNTSVTIATITDHFIPVRSPVQGKLDDLRCVCAGDALSWTMLADYTCIWGQAQVHLGASMGAAWDKHRCIFRRTQVQLGRARVHLGTNTGESWDKHRCILGRAQMKYLYTLFCEHVDDVFCQEVDDGGTAVAECWEGWWNLTDHFWEVYSCAVSHSASCSIEAFQFSVTIKPLFQFQRLEVFELALQVK